MTNAERDEIMQASREALKPLDFSRDAEAPQAEPRTPHGLPLRSSKPMDEWRAWHQQRADAREAAALDLRRQAEAERERAGAVDVQALLAVIDHKACEQTKQLADFGEATNMFAENVNDALDALRAKVTTLETELAKAHAGLADARSEMSALRQATAVDLKSALLDLKSDTLTRLDALSALLNSTAARRTEEVIDRRLGDLAGKLVN
jgi:DNA anti-recombination protein RmuC